MIEAKKIKDLKSKLDRFKDGLDRSLLVDNREIAVDNRDIALSIEEEIKQLRTHPLDLTLVPSSNASMIETRNKDQRLLDKIRVPEGSQVEAEARLCHEGTRTKVLQDAEDWLSRHIENTSVNSLLWVIGQPGAGKSAVANSLRKRLINQGRHVISFEFNQNSRTDATARVLWRSIAYQLADRFAGPRKVVLDALRDEDEKNAKSLELLTSQEIFDIFVAKAAETVRDIPLDRSPIVIIDALDECGGASRTASSRRADLLAALKKWVELPSNCRLVVTSRDESDIRNALSEISTEVVLRAGSNVDHASMADARRYIQWRLETHGRGELMSGWPTPAEVKALGQQAAGLFIWATTACDYIVEGEAPARMTELLESSARIAEMSGLYSMVLNRAFPSTTDAEQHAIMAITGTMIASSTVLSLEAMISLHNIDNRSVRITDDNAKHVIRRLHSVLVDEKVPQFAHLSFPDFLQSPSCQDRFRIHTKLQHRRLALCTLKMLSQLRFNMCKLETSHLLNDNVPDLTARVQAEIPPGSSLAYACQFWVDHLVQTDYEDELRDAIWGFLRQKALFWLEAMSLLKKTGEASRMLASLVRWMSDLVCTIVNSSWTSM
jgi:archaellum biogenesis ATPase FlaH